MTGVRHAELFSVGPDEAVVTFVTDPDTTVTTVVGDREVTTMGRYHTARVTGLEPEATYPLTVDGAPASDVLPATITTLARPAGRLLATVGTVNDVHFGEQVCGRMGDGEQLGPVFSAQVEDPYPEVMNRGAVDELAALEADAVIVKGDLTDAGREDDYERFVTVYGELGDRLHHVRGNHDAMASHLLAAHAPFFVEVSGAVLAVLDTTTPGTDKGRLPADQLEWLDELAAESTGPVLVFAHHHLWDPTSDERPATYFGVNPDDSEAFYRAVMRRENIVGYFAGHTHRNRIRRFTQARDVPMVEVACVKDYPGAWAEYRVYEGGYTQVVRRISSPEAREWTEKTRAMFAGLYRDYALGSLADRCFTQRF